MIDTMGLETRSLQSIKFKYDVILDLIKIGALKKDENIINCINVLTEAFNLRKEFDEQEEREQEITDESIKDYMERHGISTKGIFGY